MPKAEPKYVSGKDAPDCYMAFVPQDSSNPVEGELKVYMVNDSNNFVLYNYSHLKESDSTLKYLRLAMVIKDTIQSNKEESEIQNLVFEERLQKIETAENEAKLKEERSHNLQYSAIAVTLIIFIIMFLLLSHSILVNESIIRFLGILSLLIVFEFINLLLHPYLGEFVHHSPILMLSMMVFIAALLIPLHHKLEHWITYKLVEKNTQIRLTAAKRIIEAAEKN